ncbi:MAG: NAD(+)/NADH kinase [Deltaproteobacteria bacterium]|nr:NAD(+)/NADH kinase [Deltaproteobacteria bacterium]
MSYTAKTRYRKVGIVARPGSDGAVAAARRLATWLGKRGLAVLAHESWASGDRLPGLDRRRMLREADLVVVLGGDGSLLGTARLSGPSAAAVVGINHGNFGFLAGSDSGSLYRTMERVLSGQCSSDPRSMLSVRVRRGGRIVLRSQALNDAVITRGTPSRLLELEADVDGDYLCTWQGDGLIVATPTGSTAYSLSSGGPIVQPSVAALVLTPISPHTLTSRPLVVPDRSLIEIKVAGEGSALLTMDGQQSVDLDNGDVVELSRSRNRAVILGLGEESFFSLLRRKMNWGMRGR